MSENKTRFFKATMLIAFFSLLSRILGVLRSTLLAAFYGATGGDGLNDCYTAAFKLPDIIFNLVAAGAISIVLIPYLSSKISEKDDAEVNKATSQFLNFFFLLILFFIILGFIFAPFFVKNFLVSGWEDTEKIKLTITLSRILLLQVLFMTLSSVISSYLNAIEKFFSYSIAMLSYNVGIIFGILFLSGSFGIYGVIIGVVLGSFLHFFIQLIGAKINGYKYSFSLPSFNKEIIELFIVAVPRMIAISLDQIVRFFLVNFASFIFVGSIFIFDNVENIGMVFYGMIAVSISTASFPIFVKLFNSGDNDLLLESFVEKIRTLFFTILPVTFFLIIFRNEAVELLLGYRRFGVNDIKLTSDALFYYLAGIPFLSITIITVKFYYACKKSFIPMFVSIISVFFTVISTYFLAQMHKINGLAMGRSIGFTIQALMLIVFLVIIILKEKKIKKINPKPFLDIVKIISLNLILLSAFYFFNINTHFFSINKINHLINLLINSLIFFFIYFTICYILKIEEVNFFTVKIKNRLISKKNRI
ncbi:MAG TPA: murein biosynthesis integral membrane protein MurJ [Spirochaetota bacterium]|nr:murein biosynthesis integral membrane protein MurJ [Spirochaetota bacterium]